MLSLSLLLISLLAGRSIASPVSFDSLSNTFGFDEAPRPSPGLTLLDASNQGLDFFYPTSTGGGGGGGGEGEGVEAGGVPDLMTVPIHIQQQQQPPPQQLQTIDYSYSQQQQPQPELAKFEIAAEEKTVDAVEPKEEEEPNYASCIKVCCEGHYGEILHFSTGKTGFDYVNRCSLRPSTFFFFFFFFFVKPYNSSQLLLVQPLPLPLPLSSHPRKRKKITLNESPLPLPVLEQCSTAFFFIIFFYKKTPPSPT